MDTNYNIIKYFTAQKMKFFITDFFSKCEEILNGKLHFLCNDFKNVLFMLFSIIPWRFNEFDKTISFQVKVFVGIIRETTTTQACSQSNFLKSRFRSFSFWFELSCSDMCSIYKSWISWSGFNAKRNSIGRAMNRTFICIIVLRTGKFYIIFSQPNSQSNLRFYVFLRLTFIVLKSTRTLFHWTIKNDYRKVLSFTRYPRLLKSLCD